MIKKFLLAYCFMVASCSPNKSASAKTGSFTTRETKDGLVVALDGVDIASFSRQVDHYKFELTGKNVPYRRALIYGSVEDSQLAYFGWSKLDGEKYTNFDWSPDEGAKDRGPGGDIKTQPEFPQPVLKKD